MAFDLDGLAVLRAMAAHASVFPGIEADAAKIARTLLTKLLKDKMTGLTQARAMTSALPEGTLAYLTDAMTDAEVSALAARLDKINPALKTADRHAKAVLIADLTSGRAEPFTKATTRPEKATLSSPRKKPPTSGVEAAKKVLNSRAMGARKVAKAAGA